METQNLTTIKFITNTEVSYSNIGDVEGSFDEDKLKNYISRFGHEKLCTHLSFLQFQIWKTLRELNLEHDSKLYLNNKQ